MAKKRKVRNKAYRGNDSRGTLKIRFTPWRADAVASPLIGIIDQLEHQGTIDVAGGEPVFKALRSGKWCDSVSGIEGVVEMYEIHQVRAGVDLNLEPLRLLANKLKYSMPPRRPSPARPGQRMPLMYFIAVVIFIVMGLIWSFSAHGAELEFDPKAAQQEQMFKLLTWQTVNCMSAGAMNQVRMGERDTEKLAYWLVKTCGSQFAKFAIEELQVDQKRVLRLLLAMAVEEISNVPGVTLKKP